LTGDGGLGREPRGVMGLGRVPSREAKLLSLLHAGCAEGFKGWGAP
jgi:hypothetical protein